MNLQLILSVMVLFFLFGCEQKPVVNLDGKKLIEEKCASCHNLDLPPKTFTDEKAPPMMAIAFHMKNFMQTSNESERIPKAIEFVKDYVINPSESKAFCDKKSLESYGLMPSQKGNVTPEELDAITKYMFHHFTQKNLNEAQENADKLNQMPEGKKIAIKYRCLSCHRVEKDLVGPSFINIAQRYTQKKSEMRIGIVKGSSKKWKGVSGTVMPPFENKIEDEELESLLEWISLLKS